MSPHQRVVDPGGVGAEVPADRIGPGGGRRVGDRGLLPPPRRPPGQAGLPHQPGDPLAGMPAPLAAQLGVDPRRPVPALGPLVPGPDVRGQPGVLAVPVRGLPAAGGVVGGTGDLQQLARPLDVALLRFLRLDERVAVHRVSFAKKAVARLRISTSSRSLRFSRRSSASSGPLAAGQPAVLPGPGIPLGLLDPLPHRGLGQVEVLRDLTHRPVTLLAQARRSRP